MKQNPITFYCKALHLLATTFCTRKTWAQDKLANEIYTNWRK